MKVTAGPVRGAWVTLSLNKRDLAKVQVAYAARTVSALVTKQPLPPLRGGTVRGA